MLVNQRLELSDHLGMTTELELRLDQLFQRSDPKIIQTGDLPLREGLVCELSQRRAAPERQRPLERQNSARREAAPQLAATLGHEPLEAVRVEAVRIDRQLVAAVACHNHAGRSVAGFTRQRPAQAGDLHLHRLGGVGGWTLAPELVDQTVCAERLVGVQQEQRQQRTLLAPAERDWAALVEDLERAEYAEVHASENATSRANVEQLRGVGNPPLPPCYCGVADTRPPHQMIVTDASSRKHHRACRRGGRPEQEVVMNQTVSARHPAVVLRSHYTHLRALLATAMIAIVGLTAAVVILAADQDRSTVVSSAAPVTAPDPSGARYDGGPEEGTRGTSISPTRDPLSAPQSPSARYDGGPEEGTRGTSISPTRGSLSAPQSPSTRYDGGPEEGSRLGGQ